MKYKIYTLQHQKLYDQIHSVNFDEKFEKIINKEKLYLLDRCKEIRRDHAALSKVKELDALFSDILLKHKKKTYAYEHLAVHANKVYVLERKKPYNNQRQLLKEKANHLRKLLGKNIIVDFYILVENKTTKPNFISIERFIELCIKQESRDAISERINKFVYTKHNKSLGITEYIQKKYGVDISHKEVIRSSAWVEIYKFVNPFISKYKGNLSFLSSSIIFFYILAACFSYSIYAQEKQFLLTIAIDGLFLFFLINILKEVESKFPKVLKICTLLGALGVFVFLFGRVIYFI